MRLSLLSWNLLSHEALRPYAWPPYLRRGALRQTLPEAAAEICCFQEVTRSMLPLLRALLPEHDWHEAHSALPDSRWKEHLSICWRRDRFTLRDAGLFWLMPGRSAHRLSRDWNRCYPRACAWVRLADHDGTDVLIGNTHFAHRAERRQRGARCIAERLPRIAQGTPLLLAGDFNSTPNDAVFATLADAGLRRAGTALNTLQIFGCKLWAIDAVLASAPWRCESIERIAGRAGLIHTSDHCGLRVALTRDGGGMRTPLHAVHPATNDLEEGQA